MLKLFFILSALTLVALAAKKGSKKETIILTPELIKDMNKDCLAEQNKYRALHRVENLKLNDDLRLIADKAAEMYGMEKKPTDEIELKFNNEPVGLNFARFNNYKTLNGINRFHFIIY